MHIARRLWSLGPIACQMDLEAYFGQFGELADVYVHGKADHLSLDTKRKHEIMSMPRPCIDSCPRALPSLA